MKTGLVLEGGGMRGIYTAAILDVFIENDIYFDGVLGVSAGAIHGCSFVSRQKGRSLRYYKKYCKDPRFMSFQSLIRTGDFVGVDFCYHELPDKLDLFDHYTFNHSKTKFYVTCCNMETGKSEHILLTDMKKQIDYLRASASLPHFSRPVEINGKKYLDGACDDSVPVEAFQRMGYDRNVVILTREDGFVKKSEHTGLSALVYKKYPAFAKSLCNRAERYNQITDRIKKLEAEGKVFVIQPEHPLDIGRLENDPKKIQKIYDIGRADGLKHLKKMQEFMTR